MEQLYNLKQLLVTACKVLANEGLTDAFGHISVRISGSDTFCIPAFLSPALARESDLLILDFEGKVIEGNNLPNREVYIHSECYRRRPDVGSVCHSHSPMVKVFASLGEALKPIENVASLFAPETPIYQRVGLIVNAELGREVAESLGDWIAVLMRGHGSTVVGPNIQQTAVTAIYLEETAKLTYRARCIGTPICFTDEEVGRLSDYNGRKTHSIVLGIITWVACRSAQSRSIISCGTSLSQLTIRFSPIAQERRLRLTLDRTKEGRWFCSIQT